MIKVWHMKILAAIILILFFSAIALVAGTIIWALWSLRFIIVDINKINKRHHELGVDKPNEL